MTMLVNGPSSLARKIMEVLRLFLKICLNECSQSAYIKPTKVVPKSKNVRRTTGLPRVWVFADDIETNLHCLYIM
jgi:hypothetical protein